MIAHMADERREQGVDLPESDAVVHRHPLPALLQALDREAWKDFYLDHRRLVRGILASFVGYGPEVEDLTQQVFATATTLVRSGAVVLRGQPSGLRAWLAAIADRHGSGMSADVDEAPRIRPRSRTQSTRVWTQASTRSSTRR